MVRIWLESNIIEWSAFGLEEGDHVLSGYRFFFFLFRERAVPSEWTVCREERRLKKKIKKQRTGHVNQSMSTTLPR